MTMLTIDQLSFLLKFALQKMKQPGVSTLLSSPEETAIPVAGALLDTPRLLALSI